MNITDIRKLFNVGGTEQNLVEESSFTIKDNAILFKEYILQISNISQITISIPAGTSYPLIPMAVLTLIGFSLASMENSIIKLAGFSLIAIALYIFYRTYEGNLERGKNLIIELNSGSIFVISIKDKEFLDQVFGVLQENINNKQASIIVDIQNSAINFGDQNVLTLEKH